MSKTPVYFLSHGGPNIMYESAHPAYSKLQDIGTEITRDVKPKAVVIISAHWESSMEEGVEINTAESTDLIYDFYGFPAHYYREKYPNKGSKEVATQVIQLLQQAGIKVKPVSRGLDHGVWSSFKVAFEPTSNPLSVPIIQLSLPHPSSSPLTYYTLGQALSPLRSQNILLVGSGMTVHNLRDLPFRTKTPASYTKSFDTALQEAVESNPEDREARMEKLVERPDAKLAHPTFDHLWPIFVAAGAAGKERGKRVWSLGEGGVAWGMFRWGDVQG